MKHNRFAKKTIPQAITSQKKVKGVYWRADRKSYWWCRMIKGVKSPAVDLETDDYGTAHTKAAAIQENPSLQPASGWLGEIKAFRKSRITLNIWSENSATNKGYLLDRFAKDFEDIQPNRITDASAQAYYTKLLGTKENPNMKPISANTYVTLLSSFWVWLIDPRKIVRSNPWLSVKLVKVDEVARVKWVPYERFQQLIKDAPDDDLRFILYCGFHAGLRRDEIVNARPEWFNLETGILTVTGTEEFEADNGTVYKFRQKDRAPVRHIPLTKEFVAFLKTYPMDGRYMLRPDVDKGDAKYRWDFRRPYTEYMIEQHIRWCTPHVMRHSYASYLVQKGESIFNVAQWLGDSVVVVERHYAHLNPNNRSIDKHYPSDAPDIVVEALTEAYDTSIDSLHRMWKAGLLTEAAAIKLGFKKAA